MKVVVIPDKFKGSLSSEEVCDSIEKGILKVSPNANVVKHPIGDGGEGTLDILAASLQLHKRELTVKDPLFRPINSYYYHADEVAYVELALSSGLPLLDQSDRNVMETSTIGTGEVIKDAILQGCKTIYLLIGGSSSNDAGMGILHALGFRFLDSNADVLKPIGKSLNRVTAIDDSNLLIDVDQVSIKVICDVKNPFYGINGAAYIYGKQKGISAESDIETLDKGLRSFAEVIQEKYSVDINRVSGAGAAGGVGGGLYAILSSELLPGTETLLKLTRFHQQVTGADLVISGEGKIDKQTPNGKVVHGIIEYCEKLNLPVGLICGIKQTNFYDELPEVYGPYQIKTSDISFEQAINSAAKILVERSVELMQDFISNQKGL
ncbi:MAG: glycerate kinase [Bacteroidota bacterium]